MDNLSRNVLLIKNLPSALSNEEKVGLLKRFGAVEVSVLPKSGPMKHCAFLTFNSHEEAAIALNRLHQLDVLGSILNAQYARNKLQSQKFVNDSSNEDEEAKPSSEIHSFTKDSCKCTRKLPNIAPQFELNYPSNPKYTYLYPDPNADILLNICAALVTVPKFYTQVLHLMNKMNLYPPFSPAKFPPPILLEYFGKTNQPFSHVKKKEETNESSESELDIDESSQKDFNILPPEKLVTSLKRKHDVNTDAHTQFQSYKKRLKHDDVQDRIKQAKVHASTVFEDFKLNKLNPKISVEVSSVLPSEPSKNNSEIQSISEPVVSGFGMLNPLVESANVSRAEVQSESLLTKTFITEKELLDGKLTSKELNALPLFKTYNAGEPSCRLYIKNLHKKVSEKDLQHIFGMFIDCKNQDELNMFDVRLMTQGRMKGQAFVGFPSIASASRAVKLTNGFQLFGKPMIVSFARSAKPKTTT